MSVSLAVSFSEEGLFVFEADFTKLNVNSLFPRSDPRPMRKRTDLVGNESDTGIHAESLDLILHAQIWRTTTHNLQQLGNRRDREAQAFSLGIRVSATLPELLL